MASVAPYTVIALYHFSPVLRCASLQSELDTLCRQHNLCGTLILAPEGINGTVAGSTQGTQRLIRFLHAQPEFAALQYKESFASQAPFHRMKVLLKKEIVAFGQSAISPAERTGTYVSPETWNALIEDPEVTLIDTRNTYEVEVGTFEGAQSPNTQYFRDFPDYVKEELDPRKNRKIAMFCTGGIRCEKASAYLLQQGFQEVYQLHGGILKYLEDVPEEQSRWQGECFVFDSRVSIQHGLKQGSYGLCYGCRQPVSVADRQSPHYEEGVSCPACIKQLSKARAMRLRERQRQVNLAKLRSQNHVGAVMPKSTRADSSS